MKLVALVVCFAGFCFGQQWNVSASSQTSEGHVYHLRGHAEMSGNDMVFRADQIDYDEDTGVIHLAGHVTIETNGVDFDVKSGEVTLKVKVSPVR